MKKTVFDCATGETSEIDMTPEEIAELERLQNEPVPPTTEDILLNSLAESQIQQAYQQTMIDQLLLTISDMQLGGGASE